MVTIGKYVQQKAGYKAFIPERFSPGEMLLNEPKIAKLLANANLQLGKLDGLTKLLPDIDFFILMIFCIISKQ